MAGFLFPFWVLSMSGEELTPSSMDTTDFEALKTASPFVRVLDPSETYVLRGVAALDDIQMATLYNRETKKTILVTPEKANEEGLKLVGVNENADVDPGKELQGITARISFAGEEVELKYEMSQLSPVPAKGGSSGGAKSSDGDKRKGPSKEDIDRYKSLSEESRNKLRGYIGHVMKTYPNMSREERGNMIRGAMIRLSDGRDIEYPQPPQGGGGPPGGGGDRR